MNLGAIDGQRMNQRHNISRNAEQCEWCNRSGHYMSNCYANSEFENKSSDMDQAWVSNVFVNNSKGCKQELKQIKPTTLSEKLGTSSSKHITEFIQTVN